MSLKRMAVIAAAIVGAMLLIDGLFMIVLAFVFGEEIYRTPALVAVGVIVAVLICFAVYRLTRKRTLQ